MMVQRWELSVWSMSRWEHLTSLKRSCNCFCQRMEWLGDWRYTLDNWPHLSWITSSSFWGATRVTRFRTYSSGRLHFQVRHVNFSTTKSNRPVRKWDRCKHLWSTAVYFTKRPQGKPYFNFQIVSWQTVHIWQDCGWSSSSSKPPKQQPF